MTPPAPPHPSPSAAVEARQVRIALGGSVIVEDATFTARAGEILVLAGPNGAGKSTLLRALVQLLPHGGEALFLGRRPTSVAARATFVYVPDDPALYEDLTLREHARFTTMLYGRQEDEADVLAWLASFRLDDRLDELPSTHSRGMRQKLSLALALGLRTPVLILDEPYNALDLEAQELLTAGLVERAEGGSAVLLTGHQPGLAGALGARELLLRDGRLEEAVEHPHA